MTRHIALLLLLLMFAQDASARSAAKVREFRNEPPCPATGLRRGACRGWVVDHIIPLCAGGADDPRNMQWQERHESLVKDVEERRTCRALRKAGK